MCSGWQKLEFGSFCHCIPPTQEVEGGQESGKYLESSLSTATVISWATRTNSTSSVGQLG